MTARALKRRAEGFMPNVDDPGREWVHIGGDLEASYDGKRYVDIRARASRRKRVGSLTGKWRDDKSATMFLSRSAFKKALKLFKPAPIAE